MSEHLLLPEPRRVPSRRAGGGGGATPARQQTSHGETLGRQLATVQGPRRLDRGVDPKMVFKINAASRPTDPTFEGRGLQVLSESVDYTYFVLADDQGSTFADAIARYGESGDLRSFFNLIDGIEPYSADDRRGYGVRELRDFSGLRILDVSVWPAGTAQEAQARVAILEDVLSLSGGQVLLRSVSARRTYLRVQVNRAGLDDLLDTSVVETIRTPPVPFLDFQDWRTLAVEDLQLELSPSATVGVLDDAPEGGHPLLAGLVLSEEDLAPSSYLWQPRGSHGTQVLGQVLYPDLHEQLRELAPLRSVGAVRVVRILEPDPQAGNGSTRFAGFALPHEVVERAIRHLHDEHGVKVFNLSVGYADPYDDLHLGPLTEILDDLIRELDIVVVVPTGNAGIDLNAQTPSGHHVVDDKPNYFFTPQHRLAEPGPSALAITVGSVALSGAPAELPGRIGWRAVSETGEASAFTRTGPGLGTASSRRNKPELAHHGGNVVVNDTGHRVMNDLGASIVTTTNTSAGRLFGVVNGTSFAVPAVARLAADLAYAYPDASANLIRALLVLSAEHTTPAAAIPDQTQRAALYGYGVPRRDRAVSSTDNRAVMTYEGSMATDTVQIHPLPIPELFRRGSGAQRTITVAAAFDPPVRRRRREYLAASLKVDIYRNIDLAELVEILRKQDPNDPNNPVRDRKRRLPLLPGSNSFTNSTVQVRQWTATNSFVNDDETFHLVLTHTAQTWARDDPAYSSQPYAVAVCLEDQALVQASLYQLLTQQVQVPARLRVRT